ncbi:MAG: hypothetical protein HC819_19870 [Cyclobacteriaceae bacterium]|nr:hypothetical protein [Cyclobacteriaceae bacterium]
MIFLLFLSIFWFCDFACEAQDLEHNYVVGPQFTNCDSLPIEGTSVVEAIELIRKADFRYHQNFRLTRRQGFQSGNFYSCDVAHGYMIIRYDGVEKLYVNVPKSAWESLLSNPDPELYYLKNKALWQLWKSSE